MDDAIANGYVALSEKMKQLIEEEKERDAKAKEAKDILKAQRELMKAKGIKDDRTEDTKNTEEVSE
jgi:hypothetical protein